jgi:hypothetical protein
VRVRVRGRKHLAIKLTDDRLTNVKCEARFPRFNGHTILRFVVVVVVVVML